MQIVNFDCAAVIHAILAVFLRGDAAAAAQNVGQGQLVIGQHDLNGADAVVQHLVDLRQQRVQAIAGLGADPGPFIIDTAFLPLLISLRLPGLQSYRLPE